MKRYLYQCLLMAVVLAISLSSVVRAGDEVDKKVQNLPRLLGSTNVGTEFYMTFLTAWPQPGGINNIKVYVSSGVATEVVLEVKGQGYVKKQTTKPNDIIEFILPVTIAQPYFKTDRDPTPKEAIYRQQAVHIVSKDPIIVYGVTRYQYTSDGFLAIPVSSLGKEYIVASYGDVGDNGTSFGQYMPSQSFIVAAYDNTRVAFTLGGNLITRTPGGMRPGQTQTWNLQKGDVLALASFGKAADLSGSKIVATRPVGVISGNFCAYIPNKPVETGYCDVTEEMELPTNTWGKAYHVTRIFGRQKNSIIKIFAKEPDTKIYINGQHKNTIATAGGLEGIGYIERRPDEGEPGNFIISGDKPISIQQYNPGQDDDFIASDPFQLVLTPIEQFMHEITFNTPGIGDGSGFARNYINVVFQLDENRQMPEGLEFAEVSNSQFTWQSVGGRFGSFFDGFNSDIDGKAYGMKTIKLTKDGVYKIRSPLPFTAYAYGFSDYDSYGFPTSVALGDLEKPDTVAPKVTYTENCEGCYKFDGREPTVIDLPEDPEIRSNLAVVRMDGANSYNYDFSVAGEVIAGETISIGWNACPIDKAKEGRAILIFVDRAGNQTLDTLTYKPFNVSILPENPVTLDFGVLRLGNSSTQKLTIRNNSEVNPVTIGKLELSNTSTGFEVVNPPALPFTLDAVGGANNSKEIEVRFTATANSEDIDPQDGKLDPFRTEILVGNECTTIKKPMQAVVGEPVIYMANHDFGAIPVGGSQRKDIIIENQGKTVLHVTGVSKTTTNPAFSIVRQPGDVYIEPGNRTVTFTVEFAPTVVGTDFRDSVAFASDAGDNIKPYSILTGEAVAPGLFVPNEHWDEIRVDLEAGSLVQKTITIRNTGSASVSIPSVTAREITPGAAQHFIIEPGILNNSMPDLAAGADRTITVSFNPKEVGNHEYQLVFKNSAGEDKTSTLTGTGVFAGLTTESPVTFPTVNLTGGLQTSVKDVTFTAASVPAEFARGIEVTGFDFNNPTSHFNYTTDPRTEIWANGVQISLTELPVVIQPGQTLQIRNAVYAPTVAAANETASLTAITTDNTRTAQAGIDTKYTTPELARPISNWNGTAIIDPTGQGELAVTNVPFGEFCVNDVAPNLFSDISNIGDADITVETITIEDGNGNPVSSEFTIVNTPTLPLTLQPGQQEKVEVGFAPTGDGSRGPVYIVFRDGAGVVMKRATVTGSADEFETTIQLSRDKADDVQPGGDFELIVKNSTTIPQLGAFRRMHVTISYDGTVVKGTSVTPTGNYTIENAQESGNAFSFDLVAKNPGGVFTAEDLAVVKFTAFLAPSKLTQLSLAVSDVQSGCVTVNGSGTVVNIGKVCALDLRAISSSGTAFHVGQNYPNPSNAQTTIDFSVGFETPTSIVLYNSMGETIQTLIDQPLKAGTYQLDLTTTVLPSGVYYYRIMSGPYTETKQMVIAK